MATVTRLRWCGGDSFEPVDNPGEVRVIDSWLVSDGRARAIDAHRQRFTAACAELSRVEAGRFFLAALRQVPATGRWFPRAELAVADGTWRLQVWLRPAPPAAASIRLWIPPQPDQRTCPRIKGPDLAYLSALRDAAVAAGADEAVLLSPDGTVREGTTTSILWWRGETFCAPPLSAALLPGVTRAVLVDAAAARNIPVRFEHATPAELAGLQVWAVNALHGIRPVTSWIASGLAELGLLAVGVDGAAGGDGAGAAAGVYLGVEDGARHAGSYRLYQVFCPGGVVVVG
jgi:branched-subunit amino acid aminotransferase/4-amino-4-deoxychorismate lyase